MSARLLRIVMAGVLIIGVFVWCAYRVTTSSQPPDDMTVGLWQVADGKERQALQHTAAFRFDGQRVGLLDDGPNSAPSPRTMRWLRARWLNNRLYVLWDSGWGGWADWKEDKFSRLLPDHTVHAYERIDKARLDPEYAGLNADSSGGQPGA